MFRELILLNWENSEKVDKKKSQSQLIKYQSLKDLELVVGANLHLDKNTKDIHLLIKLALCRESVEKYTEAIIIWKKVYDYAKENRDTYLHNLSLNHLAVNYFKKSDFEEAKTYCLKHLEQSNENDQFTCW